MLGLATVWPLEVEVEGVMSRSETAEETAELEGVLKVLEARRTFQNCKVSRGDALTHL